MSGVLLAAAAKPVFARHETFHLRFGWLRKAYTEASRDPSVFSRDDATVQLGVGKNMVNAIRYWSQAYKVLEETPNPRRPRMPLLTPTKFGHQLLAEDGWDPYLEDTGSLWLLHWKLLTPKCLAPVWWSAFHLFAPQQFEEQQLVDHVVEMSAAAGWRTVMESSVKKDVDCLLRTFAMRRHGRQTMDDLLDCPSRELGLLSTAAGESRTWRFVTGFKATLPPEIIAYACLDYLGTVAATERTVSIARLAGDPGSPGRAFRLTETALYEALLTLGSGRQEIRVVEPAGLRQMIISGEADTLAEHVLEEYFTVQVTAP